MIKTKSFTSRPVALSRSTHKPHHLRRGNLRIPNVTNNGKKIDDIKRFESTQARGL